jgi:hypothetical protein
MAVRYHRGRQRKTARPKTANAAPTIRGRKYPIYQRFSRFPDAATDYNNSSFGLIPLEAEAVGLPAYRQGIEFPNPDFSALARAFRRPWIPRHQARRAACRDQ